MCVLQPCVILDFLFLVQSVLGNTETMIPFFQPLCNFVHCDEWVVLQNLSHYRKTIYWHLVSSHLNSILFFLSRCANFVFIRGFEISTLKSPLISVRWFYYCFVEFGETFHLLPHSLRTMFLLVSLPQKTAKLVLLFPLCACTHMCSFEVVHPMLMLLLMALPF